MKLASNGDWQWNRSYATDVTLRADLSSAIQTSDGEYIAVGTYPNTGNNNVLIIKTDANGNLLWNQKFPSSVDFATAFPILATNDGGNAILGSLDGNVWLANFAPESVIPTPTNEASPPFSTTVAIVTAVIIVVAVITVLLFYLKELRHN